MLARVLMPVQLARTMCPWPLYHARAPCTVPVARRQAAVADVKEARKQGRQPMAEDYLLERCARRQPHLSPSIIVLLAASYWLRRTGCVVLAAAKVSLARGDRIEWPFLHNSQTKRCEEAVHMAWHACAFRTPHAAR